MFTDNLFVIFMYMCRHMQTNLNCSYKMNMKMTGSESLRLLSWAVNTLTERFSLCEKSEWRQSTHIRLKMAARCSPKFWEQFFFSFQDSVSRKTIFLLSLWIFCAGRERQDDGLWLVHTSQNVLCLATSTNSQSIRAIHPVWGILRMPVIYI